LHLRRWWLWGATGLVLAPVTATAQHVRADLGLLTCSVVDSSGAKGETDAVSALLRLSNSG
jgi:hypothetical protein